MFLDRLFRVNTKLVLPGGREVTIRALSDFEMQARSRQALLASVKIEQALEREDSDEYRVYIYPLQGIPDDDLRNLLLNYKAPRAINQAETEVTIPFIPMPDDASSEEQREVLRKRDEVLESTKEKRKVRAKEITEEYKALLLSKDRDWLLSEARKESRKSASDAAFTNELTAYTVYLCTEDGNGGKFFASPAEIQGLPRQVIGLIAKKFQEINDIDPLSLNGGSAMA